MKVGPVTLHTPRILSPGIVGSQHGLRLWPARESTCAAQTEGGEYVIKLEGTSRPPRRHPPRPARTNQQGEPKADACKGKTPKASISRFRPRREHAQTQATRQNDNASTLHRVRVVESPRPKIFHKSRVWFRDPTDRDRQRQTETQTYRQVRCMMEGSCGVCVVQWLVLAETCARWQCGPCDWLGLLITRVISDRRRASTPA